MGDTIAFRGCADHVEHMAADLTKTADLVFVSVCSHSKGLAGQHG